jgi:hypothetical protein
LETLFTLYEDEVLENQRLLELELALKTTPAIWWGAHKDTITNGYQCKRLLHIRFGAEQRNNKQQMYEGLGTLVKHLEECETQWKLTPLDFIHTL